MKKPAQEVRRIVAAVFVVCGLALGGAQTTEFKKGQVDIKWGDASHTAPLVSLEMASSLRPYGKDRWMLGLVYSTPRTVEIRVAVRMALTGLAGPGKYGNKEIGNLVVQVDTDAWNFDSSQQTCTVTIMRLEPAGVEGSVVCTGEGVPFSQLKFTATP